MEEDRLSPSNPFLKENDSKPTVLDLANQLIENITAVKNCRKFIFTFSKNYKIV